MRKTSTSMPLCRSLRPVASWFSRTISCWLQWERCWNISRPRIHWRRGLEIFQQRSHCSQQLIVRENHDATGRSERHSGIEVLVLRIQEVDQGTLTQLIFLIEGRDGFPVRLKLPYQV